MNSRRFFYLSVIGAVSLASVMAFINFEIDVFGLFHNTKGKSISIYSEDRASKYLLAHRYIPENFEGYILGPSLSANLDPKPLANLKLYNMSMMGANITEQKAVLDEALKISTPRFVILCLHPYLTADHGMKTDQIDPRQYLGALGSTSLYKAYLLKIVRDLDLMPKKYPNGQYNEYGCNRYNDLLKTMPTEEKIKEQMQRSDAIKSAIDPVALKEFEEMIDELHSRKVKIVAYFHPLPYPLYNKFKTPLSEYKNTITQILTAKATILDFNAEEYFFFTKDFSNYMDHGHLSDKGRAFLLPEIIRKSTPL